MRNSQAAFGAAAWPLAAREQQAGKHEHRCRHGLLSLPRSAVSVRQPFRGRHRGSARPWQLEIKDLPLSPAVLGGLADGFLKTPLRSVLSFETRRGIRHDTVLLE